MDITINTAAIGSKAKLVAKWLFLSFFSTGWLFALGAVVMIPADMTRRDVEETKRALAATDRYAKLLEKESNATQQEKESAKRELDLTKRLQSTRFDRQLHALENLERSVIILCVWLAIVIVFWLWRFETICKRFIAGNGRDQPSP